MTVPFVQKGTWSVYGYKRATQVILVMLNQSNILTGLVTGTYTGDKTG